MGGKNQTSTSSSSQSYTPTGLNQLQDIWNKVQGVASTPYTPYGGQLTAGLDPTQQAGINTINNAQGTAQPYYDQATKYANQAAAPISASQIQNYQSPYTQQVVDAAQRQFTDSNAQQQQQVVGNAALQGALGGDRVGVAQAELARQQKLAQDPTIAGLYNQGYTQALGAAQQDRAAQGQAAYSLGSLGSAAQNTAISGGNAQLGAGAVGQGTTQAGLSAQYQQYLQQQAFPYQQAQFLASYGLPAATAQGGTQQGQSQTTQPGPNIFGQIAGLGLAGLGAAGGLGWKPFAKDGGRINGYASGGSVPGGAENFILVPSYVPQANAPQASTPQISPMQTPKIADQKSNTPSFDSAFSAFSKLGGGSSSPVWNGGTPLEGGAAPWQGGIGHAANGGRIYATGGAVTPSPYPGIVQGYDNGGNVDIPFSSRWADVDAADTNFNRPASVASPYPVLNSDTLGLGKPVDWSPAQQNAPSMIANGATPQNIASADLPPPMANQSAPTNSPMSYAAIPVSDTSDDGSTTEISADSVKPDKKEEGTGLFGLSKNGNLALIAAGLGMAASRSPFALSQIGEGGLQGLGTYNQLTKQSEDKELQKQKVDLEAKRLVQTASQFATTAGETKRYHDILDQGRKDALGDKQTRSGYMKNPDGTMSIIKGGPADPEVISASAKAKASATDQPNLSESAIKRGVEQMLAGDYSIKQNLGRGKQGAANLTALENAMADEMDKRGMTGAQRAAVNSNFKAQTAAMKTAAVREANVSASVEEAKNTFPLALKASADVPRTQFVPWNKLVQQVQAGTSNKELAKLYTATQGAITAYAQAMARTGVMTVDGRHAAEALLQTATSQEAYEAVIGQMAQEMKAAEVAPETVRHAIMSRISGAPPPTTEQSTVPGASPPPTASPAAAVPQRVKQGGHTYERQPDGSMKAID